MGHIRRPPFGPIQILLLQLQTVSVWWSIATPERREECARVSDRTEHASLHGYHRDCRCMVIWISCTCAIRQHEAFESPVVCLSHRCRYADVGCDSGQNQVRDFVVPQDEVHIGCCERALGRLIDD